MSAETVPAQDAKEPEINVNQEVQPVEPNQEPIVEAPAVETPALEESKETQVPLKALQKERQKRQEIEYEYKYYKEQQDKARQPQEPDESQYDPVTKADLNKQLADRELEIVRKVQESDWRRNNPDKATLIDQGKLDEFLKQYPNQKFAIANSTNRYAEAWDIMQRYEPKQKAVTKAAPVEKQAPGSPSGVPKAAGINQAVNMMHMSDTEYEAWVASKCRRG